MFQNGSKKGMGRTRKIHMSDTEWGKGNGVLMRPVGQLDSRCPEGNLAWGLRKLEDSRHSYLRRAGTFGVVPGCLSLQVLASRYSHSHGSLPYKTKSNHGAEERVCPIEIGS